jgi:hypothetical protein
VLALFLGGAEAVRANFVIGLPPDGFAGNYYPFGGPYGSGGTGEYQQVYTETQFPTGPVTITGLQFFNTQFDTFADSLPSAAVTISLSTTSADWNTLSRTYANNIGGNNTLVFSGNLSQPWTFGETLTIPFTTDFTYNPAPGSNLFMDVEVSGARAPGGIVLFDTNGLNNDGFNGNTIVGRVFTNFGEPNGPTGNVDSGYGLVTGFETVPAPPSVITLLTGTLGLLGYGWRKRK